MLYAARHCSHREHSPTTHAKQAAGPVSSPSGQVNRSTGPPRPTPQKRTKKRSRPTLDLDDGATLTRGPGTSRQNLRAGVSLGTLVIMTARLVTATWAVCGNLEGCIG